MKTGQCEGCGRRIHVEAGDRSESPEFECDCVECDRCGRFTHPDDVCESYQSKGDGIWYYVCVVCAGERDRRRVMTLEDAP